MTSVFVSPIPRRHHRRDGYSLVELTIATGILAAGVAAAASLTLTSARLEEMNQRKARVLALSEAAARLWQLGLSPGQVAQLLPGDPSLTGMSFNGSSGDPTTMAPSDQGSAVADPAADVGTFETVTIRTTVTLRDGSPDEAQQQEFTPIRVVR